MVDIFHPMKLMEYKFVLEYISKFPKGSKILDTGCGDGKLVAILIENGYDAWGIELGELPDAVAWNYQIPLRKDRIKYEDMRKSSFSDKSFDIIFCISTLINVGLGQYGTKDPVEEYGDVTAMKEFIRLLKDDGRIIVTLAYGEAGVRDRQKDYRVYDDVRLERLFEGLEIIESHYFYWNSGVQGWVETNDKEQLRRIFPKEQTTTLGNSYFVLKKKESN